MIKYILILCANIVLLYYFVMVMVDRTLIPKEIFPLLLNIAIVLTALWICFDVFSIYVFKKRQQESGIVYKIASKSKSCGLAFYAHVQPFQKEFVKWTIIALVVAFLGMLLMGIPGYLLLAIPAKLGLVQEIQGDNAWPAAILLSMLWPVLFPLGILVKQHLIKTDYASYAFSGFLGTVIAGVIGLIVLFYLAYGRAKA
jgi:hypothetical protein